MTMTIAPPDLGGARSGRRVWWTLAALSTLVVAFVVSLLARKAGSYYTAVDGWGVCLLELSLGVVCISRYFEGSWRSSQSAAKVFPLILGAACISWALGDVTLTIESLGGATPSVPSVADGFYVGFFPLCYLSIMALIRGSNHKSLVATSLDGLTAGLGVASISAAFLFNAVLRATGGGRLATATSMVYPSADVLLLALAIGGLAVLPKEYRRFLAIASVAFASNAVGDLFNLLQPSSKIGYVTNGAAWPISLLMLAIAVWVLPAKTEKVNTQKIAGFALPAVGAAASLFIVFAASIGHIGKAAVGLAAGTLLVAAVRLTLTMREAQALNSARFRSLIDNAWDLIVVAETDLSVAYVTPSSDRMLGYSPADLQATPITELMHPNDRDSMVEHLQRLALGTTETAAFETRMLHRNGAWRTIAWTATNLLADLSVRGYVLNGSDVTEARQAAEDVAAARDGALMASKAKSDFLSTMSHEIRTPMNGVIGLTELLLETRLDTEQQELASGVKVSAENLLVIINDILDFSKIEAGKLDVEEAELNVSTVVDDVGRILAGTAHGKGIELLIDVHPNVPTALLGDPVRIQQVLLNLASNAVKFTAEGEVVTRVFVLHENAERVALRFEVVDMGIGIAVADQKRLFRPFAQADSSTTRRFGGTGLGLAISRQLVELMGGHLGLTSAPGEGSTFWFELSLRRAGAENAADTVAGPRRLAGRRALVVDDNTTNRKILRQQLASWGVETVEAVDGYEALWLAAAAAEAGEMFELGVIDLNMPGMDGMELARDLKGDPATSTMTLFLLSSSGERLGPAESHLRGFAASLTKPVRSSELFDVLITSLGVEGPAVASAEPEAEQAERPEVVGMILLVEDNKMNQLVGSKVLGKLGYQFDIANHGGEAVSAVRERNYDAILMDCQMPEMDGYEATARIRCLEGSARHTPIIAMTAAAMDGDRDTCLEAGMDDYITKPVRLEVVAAALERWVRQSQLEPTGAERATMAPRTGGPGPLDPSQIQLLRSLDDGEGAVLSEVIEQYLVQTLEGREELGRAVTAGETSARKRAAHTLKGASANVGAGALAAICGEFEMGPAFAHPGDAAELLQRFDAEFDRVRSALGLLSMSTSTRT
jgi:PAS domain S-box-containing protein